MRRVGFKRAIYDRPPPSAPTPIRKTAPPLMKTNVVALPKQVVVRSEAYRRLVAALPCQVCGISGYGQAAHPNTNKGAGVKTDDRLCFALCCDRPGVQGCHPKFDQGALFDKQERRELETVWAAQTMWVILMAGDWPAGLPRWEAANT